MLTKPLLFFPRGQVLYCTNYCVTFYRGRCVECVLKTQVLLPNVLPWREAAVGGESERELPAVVLQVSWHFRTYRRISSCQLSDKNTHTKGS